MNPQPHLHLARADAGFTFHPWHIASRERHAVRSQRAVRHGVRLGQDLVQRAARRGGRTGHLVHEQRAREPASPRDRAVALVAAVHGDIIADDHHPHVQALRAGLLGGDAKVEPVARVILDDEQAPAGARHAPHGVEHGLHGRAREDAAADRTREHALADEARVRWLVACVRVCG